MSFKREKCLKEFLKGEELTQGLLSLGVRIDSKFTNKKLFLPEDVLVSASIEGVEGKYRTLSLVASWCFYHFQKINVTCLINQVSKIENPVVRAFWSAMGTALSKDRRFKKLEKVYSGPRINCPGAEGFHFKKYGEDQNFINSVLKVPANGLIRIREKDTVSPSELCKINPFYKWRTIIGPSYRADMWALAENNKNTKASELARKSHGSFATAYAVLQDQRYLAAANGNSAYRSRC
ncbi:MAG: hypothetical protein HQK49_15440 [Oligoflexia bacterium]|nr:hypothetical protein [Oligoflexia bacterium]